MSPPGGAVCPAADDAVLAQMDDQYNTALETKDKPTYDAALASIRAQLPAMARGGNLTGVFLQHLSSHSRNAPTYFSLLDASSDNEAYTTALQSALLSAPSWEEREVFAFHLARVTTSCANDHVFTLLRETDDSGEAISTKVQIAHAFVTSKSQEVQSFAIDLSKQLRERFAQSPSMDAVHVSQELNRLLVLLGTTDAADALGDNLLGFGSASDWSAAFDDVQHLADPRLHVPFMKKSLLLAEVDPAAKATLVEILFAHDPEFSHTPNLTSILTQIATELEADGQENEGFSAIKTRLIGQ